MVVALRDLGFLFCCSDGLIVISCWENLIVQRHFRGTRCVGDPKRHFRVLGGAKCAGKHCIKKLRVLLVYKLKRT